MLIGLIADTHDNLPKIKKAVQIFNKEAVKMVLHAGDYIAPFSLGPLEELNCPYLGVFGNNDGERMGLTQRSNSAIKNPPERIELDGKRIVLIHDLKILPTDSEDKYDLIIYGHTHRHNITKEDETLIINPGECGGWVSGESTIAITDLKTGQTEIIKI